MKSIQAFNDLHKKDVTRQEIERVISLAKEEEQYTIVDRLNRILMLNPDDVEFRLNIVFPPTEEAPVSILNGIDEDYHQEPLNKPVPPAEIYQMITDKVINMVKKASAKDYKRKWEVKGYMIPFNFVSKKRYRGVNHLMLTELDVIENPFFLTFKQVQELGGKVKKDAQGYEVIYFSNIYEIRDTEKELRFSSFDIKKVTSFILDNGLDPKGIIKYPILKYYNVFNGNDIEGIDFDLENFKIGYTENDIVASEKNRLDIPEAIIKNYPTPQPKIQFGGQKAYFRPSADLVNLPVVEKFATIQDYYRTMFHELSHSTGVENRLNRDMSGDFGSKPYAFEELIAELGSIFLSAEAGIKWHSNKNHAAYLKSWNNALVQSKDDNKFIMKAATNAQKIADFVLQFDSNGNPKYLKDLKKKPASKAVKTTVKTKKVVKPVVKKEKPTVVNRVVKISKIQKQKNTIEKSTQKVDPKTKQISLFGADKNQIDFEKLSQLATTNPKEAKAIWVKMSLKQKKEFKNHLEITDAASEGNFEGFLYLIGAKAPKSLKGFDIVGNTIGNMVANAVLGEPEKKEIKISNVPENSLAYRLQNKNKSSREYYKIPNKDIAEFLGKVEVKKKESVAITIAGGQGSMKTRLCFQLMNDFAQNYKVGHASIEEHPESALYEDKVHQYLNEKALHNVSAPEINTIDDVHKLVRENDVIIIDSFSKLQEMQKGCELDKDFRKAYDGKLFIIIYQQTTDGKMRGGSKSQFDGDIICFVQKEPDYKNNYCYTDKNRYQDKNLEDLKFNIFSGKLLPTKEEIQLEEIVSSEPMNFNFLVK